MTSSINNYTYYLELTLLSTLSCSYYNCCKYSFYFNN